MGVIREPAVIIPTISLAAVNICFGSVMSFLPLLMLDRGISEFNSYYVAYAVAVIFSRMWVGKLCQWLTPERLSFYILLLFSLTMLGIGYFAAEWMLIIAGSWHRHWLWFGFFPRWQPSLRRIRRLLTGARLLAFIPWRSMWAWAWVLWEWAPLPGYGVMRLFFI